MRNRATPADRPKAGQELVEGEWLREIVVGTRIQSMNHISTRIASRQHHIEDDNVVGVRQRVVQPFRAVMSNRRDVPSLSRPRVKEGWATAALDEAHEVPDAYAA